MLLLSSDPADPPPTIEDIVGFIGAPDPALVAGIGYLDAKLCQRLVQDLETLRLNKSALLSSEGERLETELLLGLGKHARPGKTRLSVVSTKFLGDGVNVDFWVSQMLLDLIRWSSKNPSPTLQAVCLFDEADRYLPAQGKPATKEPMDSLLKRARSAGIGIFLASQSPGDFDYRCRDNIRAWFLGRITGTTSIDKMKPLFAEFKGDVAGKLPGQGTGQFHLAREGSVVALRADRSIMKTSQLPEDDILALSKRKG